MTVGSRQDTVWPVRSCGLPIDLSHSFSSLGHLQKEETEELQRRCSSVTRRCLIQTTLLIYLYAVQLGFLHFSKECTVITQLRFVKVYLMYHKLGFLRVRAQNPISNTLMLPVFVVYKPHLAPFKLFKWHKSKPYKGSTLETHGIHSVRFLLALVIKW